MGHDELADGGVQGETVDAIPDGDDQDGRRGVHAVASGNQVFARLADVLHALRFDFRWRFGVEIRNALRVARVDTPDRTGGNGRIDV